MLSAIPLGWLGETRDGRQHVLSGKHRNRIYNFKRKDRRSSSVNMRRHIDNVDKEVRSTPVPPESPDLDEVTNDQHCANTAKGDHK